MHRNFANNSSSKKPNPDMQIGKAQQTSIINKTTSSGGPIDNLPKQFVAAMRTLFDIMDDKRTGFVRLSDIEQRWQDDGAKGLPQGVIESLRKVTPLNGMLSFERFCAGLKICLLRNQSETIKSSRVGKDLKSPPRPPSAPLLDLENAIPTGQQWKSHNNNNNNNTAAVRPNNAMPVQRTLSLPKLNPDSDNDTSLISELPIILPSLYAPPKPPRTALVMGNGVTNINNLDRLDKAEIRYALQNWQMGVLMNEMDAKDKNRSGSEINRGTADGSNGDVINQQKNGIYLKKPNNRRREPRRHTLQNGIDYNMLKKLKQFEQEKDLLLLGLNAVEKTQEWYFKQISIVQEKIKYLGRMGSDVEQWSESNQERLDLQRARVMEVNRHLSALADSWERGGFSMHMNLAVRNAQQQPFRHELVDRLKQQNRLLTEDLSQKNDRINVLERERQTLVRELVKSQRTNKLNGSEEAIF